MVQALTHAFKAAQEDLEAWPPCQLQHGDAYCGMCVAQSPLTGVYFWIYICSKELQRLFYKDILPRPVIRFQIYWTFSRLDVLGLRTAGGRDQKTCLFFQTTTDLSGDSQIRNMVYSPQLSNYLATVQYNIR